MASRAALQSLLVNILGTNSVYFQPPTGFQLKYPCIVYHLDDISVQHANNKPYRLTHRYSVTYMDTKNPNAKIIDALISLKLASFNTQFITDNVYHTVFTIYF